MKKNLLKMFPLTLSSIVAFVATIYMLYQLYLLGSPLVLELAVSVGSFSLSILLLFYFYVKLGKDETSPQPSDILSVEPDVDAKEATQLQVSTEVLPEVPTEVPSELLVTVNEVSENNILFKIDKPRMEMDIISAARDAMDSLAPFAEAQNIRLHLSTTNDTLMIMAEPESIRILFRNIIDNSIKYMGRAGHMIITISLLGDDIFIILKDTGKGLSEDETTHVFELNFQGSNRVSGNGLGLAQTKMIVEAFGGTIYAKSSLENGMAIYIQLPVSGQRQE